MQVYCANDCVGADCVYKLSEVFSWECFYQFHEIKIKEINVNMYERKLIWPRYTYKENDETTARATPKTFV